MEAEPHGEDEMVELLPLREMQAAYVRLVLKRCGGNISAAARVLQIERSSLQRMMRRNGDR